jgi:hypothetical protein
MGFYLGNILAREHKQHLNLSSFAWLTIEQDMINFSRDLLNTNLSGFLNKIISNFYDFSLVSINNMMTKRKEKILLALSNPSAISIEENQKSKLLEILLKVELNETLEQIKAIKKSSGRKFRINKENKLLLEELAVSRFFDNDLGLYLRGLFEDYAKKSSAEREAIYFFEIIAPIKEAISLEKRITIKLSNQQKFQIRPFAIVSDQLSYFNYLVGLSHNEKSVMSFRISRINKVKISYSLSGKITKDSVLNIEKILLKKGVQFLVSNTILTKIRLTPRGIEKYKNQLHLRPNYIEIKGDEYTFDCSENQILFYFSKFGKDCEILSPKELREKFKNDYFEAYKTYQ